MNIGKRNPVYYLLKHKPHKVKVKYDPVTVILRDIIPALLKVGICLGLAKHLNIECFNPELKK